MSETTPPVKILASRWTPGQIENAHRIVNDIAEDIDNRESRKEMRQALAIYADLLHDKHHEANDERMGRVLFLLEQLQKKEAQNPIGTKTVSMIYSCPNCGFGKAPGEDRCPRCGKN